MEPAQLAGDNPCARNSAAGLLRSCPSFCSLLPLNSLFTKRAGYSHLWNVDREGGAKGGLDGICRHPPVTPYPMSLVHCFVVITNKVKRSEISDATTVVLNNRLSACLARTIGKADHAFSPDS